METFVAKPATANAPRKADQLFRGFEVKSVSPAAISGWLKKGWQDMMVNPVASLTYGIIFAAVGIILGLIAAEDPVFSVATTTGFFLVGPFLALGLYDLSRQHETNQHPNFLHSARSLNTNAISFGVYAMFLGLLMVSWVRLAAVVTAIFFNNVSLREESFIGMWRGLLSMNDGWLFALTFIAVGFLFAALAFATGVVTGQVMLDRKVDIVTGITTSMKVVKKNPLTMALWAIVITAIVGLGLVTLNLGLIIAMPLVAHASWHAYREIVKPVEVGNGA